MTDKDNAAWEKAERERFEEHWIELPSRYKYDGPEDAARQRKNMKSAWLAKARQARVDAVKDAARLEKELAAVKRAAEAECNVTLNEPKERDQFEVWLAIRRESSDDQWSSWLAKARKAGEACQRFLNIQDAMFQTETCDLKNQLATANERCAKAEAYIRTMGFDKLSGKGKPTGVQVVDDAMSEIKEAFDAWQLTLPAEQKEADESEICNHCDKTSPPHDLGVCAGCGDHYCNDHLNAHCQSCLM